MVKIRWSYVGVVLWRFLSRIRFCYRFVGFQVATRPALFPSFSFSAWECDGEAFGIWAALFPVQIIRGTFYHSHCTPERSKMQAQRIDTDSFPKSFMMKSRISLATQGGGLAR